MPLININNLSFAYDQNEILKNINLDLNKGDFLAISGENGSGKTTLVKILTKELPVKRGYVKIFGSDINDFDNFQKIGYVPQLNESQNISFPLTCREYVILNLYSSFGRFKRPTKENVEIVEDTFKILNIENLIDKPFNKLSGGQQQRVMIARCLVNNPEVLILDEPTVGIDQANKEDFLKLLLHLNKKHGLSIIIISHEMEFIKNYVNKIVLLKEGLILDAWVCIYEKDINHRSYACHNNTYDRDYYDK